MAARAIAWLGLAAAAGTRVLIGDPGRRYLPGDLERVATYRVRTSLEIEKPTSRPRPCTRSRPEPDGRVIGGWWAILDSNQ